MLLMRRLRPLIMITALVTCAFGTAHAGKKYILGQHPHPVAGFGRTITLGTSGTIDSSCALGNLLVPVDNFDYFTPEGGPDSYYVLVDPATCTGCSSVNAQMRVDHVHLSMWFPATCTQPVDITFLGVTGPSPSCPKPDEHTVLAGPFHFDLPGVATADGDPTPLFDLALPTTVVLPHHAFLGMSISSFGTCNVSFDNGASFVNSQLVYGDTTACDPCKNYNYYFDSDGINKVDYCVVVNSPNSQFRLGPPIMSALGTCGSYVPVMPISWGRLKIRYNSPRRRRRLRSRRRTFTRSAPAA